ncbi:hypothetical protein [Desertihabitans aurantiacus]|uniref:hypothetical protein n=1 Tax=Desertihabitans aurantiacus TaxID=2282477 RepID=UPI001E6146B3|nr:hypothetical protein [Desertihabitans aurantiacus]
MLSEQFRRQVGHRPSPAEQRSWRESLAVLANDLNDAGLSGVEMLLEYQLPLTSKRVDALLCGTSPKTGHPVYFAVLAQAASEASMLVDSEEICVFVTPPSVCTRSSRCVRTAGTFTGRLCLTTSTTNCGQYCSSQTRHRRPG